MLQTKFQKDKLNVEIYENAEQLGKAAAILVATVLNRTIAEKKYANLILATGASQFLFLKHLKKQNIAWKKITVFHLDEYKGLSETHPASFRKYLKDRILKQVQPKEVFYLNGDAPNIETEILQYEELLKNNPVDIACIGIGENGHIAFNDPPVADFNDPLWVKTVKLDDACRQQQYGEGWFPTFEDVPEEALSLTIPAIMASKSIVCTVPDERKSKAVRNTLLGKIDTSCPASILRTHSNAVLLLDQHAASKIHMKD
ncbi:MAG: glucosamine-6-phosphate deaminase [Mariniphaga sp.]|nr:glucosamine-6-phosphate deaminase [Mariniphaga sp.]